LVRLLAYQYRDLFGSEYKNSDECQKFKKFVKNQLGLDIDREISGETKKVIKFSYPDLEFHQVRDIGSLKDNFCSNFSNAELIGVYVVYVREDAPQIGFTASVVFDIHLDDANRAELKKRFGREFSNSSMFHEEFKKFWEFYADKRKTLPAVLFVDEICKPWLFCERPFGKQIFGAPDNVTLSSGRSASLERGFPYVSYVLHTNIELAMREEIHKCDFAILMALPGFVENNLESIRKYRVELRGVQKKLEEGNFGNAEKQYSAAWQQFEKIQGLMPTTTAAVQRIKQKYPGKSVFAAIADDNTQLIESTVNAAIEATEQIRANIQAFAQRKLQRSVNWLQAVTVFLTALLVITTAITTYVSFKQTSGTTKTRISGIDQAVYVSPGPFLDESTKPQSTLRATLLFAPHTVPLKREIYLEFRNKNTTLPVELATPLAMPGMSRIELFVLGNDGVILAKDTVAAQDSPTAVRLFIDKNLVSASQTYFVQIQQGNPSWRVRLPMYVRFVK